MEGDEQKQRRVRMGCEIATDRVSVQKSVTEQ